ncbi:MAG: hypothetical protein WA461_13460, partial [Nitrososphaeraceae archaeon]
LKHGYGEYIQYENVDPEVTYSWISSACREPLIVPVNFQLHHKAMAKHLVKCIAHRRVRIHANHCSRQYDHLIIKIVRLIYGLVTSNDIVLWTYSLTS